ncbi:MAG: periplasmic heavy metal sensor [Halomonas sp.]|jgi:uncharacterized membrane protein|uniref:periplasmic heavy metal sensor n=1 Tax=Halomonas sp. TaxID=1486246 RepID=UPI00397101C1
MGKRLIRISITVLVVVSLLMNILMLGFGFRIWQLRGDTAGVVLKIPKDMRRMLRNTVTSSPQVKSARDRLETARASAAKLISKPSVDRAELEEAFAEIRAATTALQQSLHKEMIAVATKE